MGVGLGAGGNAGWSCSGAVLGQVLCWCSKVVKMMVKGAYGVDKGGLVEDSRSGGRHHVVGFKKKGKK